MDIREAFEQSLTELGITNLDDNSDDILAELDENTEPLEPEDGAEEGKSVEEPDELGDSDEQEDAAETDIIDIKAGASIRLPDGTVVPADKAILMQADYTRKTQELSQQRKEFDATVKKFQQHEAQVNQTYEEMRQWYEQRASNPSRWIAEIASNSPDATGVVAQALYDLASSGALDPKFVETFGLQSGDISERARQAKLESEINSLRTSVERKQLEEQQRAAEQQRQDLIQKRAAVYEQEWEEIKATNNLQFSNRLEEIDAKRELLQFAMENKLTKSLLDAYDLMSVRVGRSKAKQPRQPEVDVSENKRASRAVTPKTSVSGAAKRERKIVSDREAILEAMEALSL